MKYISLLFTKLLALLILVACSNDEIQQTSEDSSGMSAEDISEYKKKHDIDAASLDDLLSTMNNKSEIKSKAEMDIEKTPLNTVHELWLNSHNKLRKQHKTKQLEWSHRIAQRAQQYANKCPSGHSISAGKYGENIAFATYAKKPNEVVNDWYNEISLYDYIHPTFNTETAHFTQLIWKNTRLVGCAYKSGCHGKFSRIWVCQYEPSGNVMGGFATNVRPLSIRKPKKLLNDLSTNSKSDTIQSGERLNIETIEGKKIIRGSRIQISEIN